jgi:hypothetical protein
MSVSAEKRLLAGPNENVGRVGPGETRGSHPRGDGFAPSWANIPLHRQRGCFETRSICAGALRRMT